MLGVKYYSSKIADEGDVLTFVDEGGWVESQFKRPDGSKKNNFQITVTVEGERHLFNLNKTNSDVLIEAFGHDTQNWIGKSAKVRLKNVEVAGEDVLAIRLTPVVSEARPKKEKVKKSKGMPPVPVGQPLTPEAQALADDAEASAAARDNTDPGDIGQEQ